MVKPHSADPLGWDRLRHGGLLLDPARLRQIEQHVPPGLTPWQERELRRRAGLVQAATEAPADFAAFVLEEICGFDQRTGGWQRGSNLGTEWTRRGVAGEAIRPRMLWQGGAGARLPVFLDDSPRVGIGRGRRAASHVLQWLRAGTERLALLTNGRQWRLIFAGLDFDAWCEWDVDLWFEEGDAAPQVTALRTLLSWRLWTPPEPKADPPLLQAILDSRKGQAELSAELGERVRAAVELLVDAHGDVLKERCGDVAPADIYRAAVRVVMRMVVVMFAESRELLPRDNALYHASYGLGGLLEELEKIAARGGNRLGRSWNAWPRVLALFRLVHGGSHHPSLPVPRYGGELFAPGDAASNNGLSRALAVFETACFDGERMSDRDVHRMLERITRTRVRVRQGRGSTWVAAPVDFSDLSSEYIGILYEGLLDFELKTAPAGDPVIFLAVGNQPALPLSRLEAMDDKAIANLLEKMKDTSSKSDDDEAEEEEMEEADDVVSESSDEPEASDSGADDEGDDDAAEDDVAPDDARHVTRTRAEQWARRAVAVGKLVRKPAGRVTPERQMQYEDAVGRKARRLVTRVVLPGEWYLVRWGGTRKGSGTFYTRPALAVPTVQRTLRPLAYDPPVGDDGEPDRFAPAARWKPKTPEAILALKVCDPACGSGTFPVAALRFLTDALYAALHEHGRISRDGDKAVVRLLEGTSPEGPVPEERLGHELLPAEPESEQFEPTLKAVLRRYVVERCIYGVDLDPLAVELCRLALWIETMDRRLPFSFLDHKIRVGNSLIGAWFDTFEHYPVMAWKNREGGDKNHNNGVHFEKDARGKAIKAFLKDRLTPDLQRFLGARTLDLFSDTIESDAGRVHDEALAILERMHALPVHDAAERARIYRDELLASPSYRALKEAMDRWCACWFWPADRLDLAPLPTEFARPRPETSQLVRELAASKRFFHWELEFPDVFSAKGSGFGAVLGNPPWDIAKPNSKEFFSNVDPLYRSYGKQEALGWQEEYFASEEVERSWLDYSADFRAQSNFVSYSAAPFGDPEHADSSQDRFAIARGRENHNLHATWRAQRQPGTRFADARHPYRHQGSADLNLYKLFLEQAHALLRDEGRLGFIVPSGLYSDHGTGALRNLFLEQCRWEWLFGFENREKVFAIDSRFKFNPVIVQKGGATEAIRTAFMRRRLEDWDRAESLVTLYTRAQVEQFSPRSRAILEIQSQRDLEILEKIYANSVLLGDDGPDGWGIKYATEFHMTNDSKLFPPRPKWEAQGYRPDEYSRWLKGDWRPIEELWAELGVRPLPSGEQRVAQPPYDTLPIPRADIPVGFILSREADAWIREERIEDIALPLYEGRMIGQFDFSQKGWVSGSGRGAVWRDIDWERKYVGPQYLVRLSDWQDHALKRYLAELAKRTSPEFATSEQDRLSNAVEFARWWNGRRHKAGLIDVTSATNTRTTFATTLPERPCGNSAPVLGGGADPVLLTGILNSLCYDFSARSRCGGVHLNWFVLDETPLPRRVTDVAHGVGSAALRLACANPAFADLWLAQENFDFSWREQWAVTKSARVRLRCAIDAIVAFSYGVTASEFAELLVDCDWPRGRTAGAPKGFWRVDSDMHPELRHTVLALVAMHDLESAFCNTSKSDAEIILEFVGLNGDGWRLPSTIRLSDYGLGRDERARTHQAVSGRLGPAAYAWQAGPPDEEWRECAVHAANLIGSTADDRVGTSEVAGEEIVA